MGIATDITVAALAIFFAIHGWRQGTARTLIGPLSLILNLLVAYVYFKKCHNITGFLLIMLLGPMVLAGILILCVDAWHKNIDRSLPPSTASRFFGSTFNLFWGAGITMSALITIAILPANILKTDVVKQNVLHSYSYLLTERFVKNKIPFINDTEAVLEVSQNENKIRRMQSSEEFMDLYRDPKIQGILSDKEMMEQIKNKDIVNLFSNPKFLALWQDAELAKKILKIQANIVADKAYEKAANPNYSADESK